MCALDVLPKNQAGASMFGFLKPVRSEATDPLANPAAARSFWQTLPTENAIAAQQAVCKALAEPVARGRSNVDRLQALRLHDQRARDLVDLLVSSDGANPDSPFGSSRSWQAVFEVCRAFGRAYGQFLRLMRESHEFEGQRESQSFVVLRLFRHRQLELLLRPFTDDRAPAFSWKEIHDAYKFAEANALLGEALSVNNGSETSAIETRLEREYVYLLMQDLMNGAQFPPHEASWVNKCIPRWCLGLALKADDAPAETYRFVVDHARDCGLVRSNEKAIAGTLSVDMTPALKAIAAQTGTLRDAERPADSSLSRGRQLKVLQKVSALCTAERILTERRAERRRTAAIVEVVVGLPHILRRLRNKSEEPIAPVPRSSATNEGMTISGFGPPSQDSDTNAYTDGGNTETQLPPGTALCAQLTIVDESDNGCRLTGPAIADNPTIPGALVAFRESGSPWTLAVIRRVKKRLAGRRVEIGLEYLGKAPRWVVSVICDASASRRKTAKEEQRFAGLYLPGLATSPMKTLVLPACGFGAGIRLEVRSRTSVHSVRLKEPLEEQADFVWTPFEILDCRVKTEAESSTGAQAEPVSEVS